MIVIGLGLFGVFGVSAAVLAYAIWLADNGGGNP